MFSGKMPAVTQVQVLAALKWIIGQAVIMGLCDSETSKVILSAGSSLLAAAWIVGDALLRGKRAQAVATDPNSTLEQ
jgi:hypothetical protein